jgi:Leucine-rich repeat (LRR) protein
VSGVVGFNLKCEERNWNKSEEIECIAVSLNITKLDQFVTRLNGNDLKLINGSNFTVVALGIYNQTANFVAQNFGSVFPKLVRFSVYKSMLKEIHKKDLAQFPKLKDLQLSENEIEVLPSNLFEGNLGILSINLSFNRITNVGSDLLTPLKQLQKSDFNHNLCINQAADSPSTILAIAEYLKMNCAPPGMHHIDFLKKNVENLESKMEQLGREILTAKAKLREAQNGFAYR